MRYGSVIWGLVAACGHPHGEMVDAGCAGVPINEPTPAPFPSELGLVTVDPQTPTPANGHMFYVLVPADSNAATKPLFVLFNGGPGLATTAGLLDDSTAPNTLVEDVQCHGAVVGNPASFTSLGNLLYLDQRETGFSYDDGPTYADTFDMKADAIDFTRAILRVLDSHPQLTASRVVLLGESYGGARAQLILHDLLHYTDVPAIAVEAKAHLDAVFASEAVHPPDEIAQQFFAQVLIEPVVMGAYQTLPPPPGDDTCPDDTRLSTSQCSNTTPLYDVIQDPLRSAALFGGRLEDVVGLSGPARHGARMPEGLDPDVSALNDSLVQRLGPLAAGDYYYSPGGPGDSSWSTDRTLVPPAFVDNLRYVRTLITNATYDGNVDTTQIPVALTAYGVTATLDRAPRPGTDRPGWVNVTLPDGNPMTIRMPTYAAGHAVTATQAMQLRADTSDWLGLSTSPLSPLVPASPARPASGGGR